MVLSSIGYPNCHQNPILLSHFSDYFGSAPSKEISNYQATQSPDSGWYYVDNTYIGYFYQPAIYLSTRNDINVSIEYCMFYNISAGLSSGTVVANIPNGRIVVANSCFARCYLDGTDYGQAFKMVIDKYTCMIMSVSLTQCAPDSIITRYALSYHSGGKHYFSYTNASKNILYQFSSFYCTSCVNVSISYCTIRENNAIYAYSLYIQSCSNSYIQFTNIYGNNSPTANTAVVYSGSNSYLTYVMNCIFMENSGILLAAAAPGMTLTNCIIQHISGVGSGYVTGAVTITTQTATHNISHFRTYYCYPLEGNEGLNLSPCQTIPQPPTNCLNPESLSGLKLHSLITSLQYSLLSQLILYVQ